MNKINNKNSLKAGFTLIELLMSLAIFIIITTLFSSTTIVLIDLNRKAENTRTTLDALDFVLTSMVKKIRYGYSYDFLNGNENMACMTDDRSGYNAFSDGLYVTVDEGGDDDAKPTPTTYRYWLSNEGFVMRSKGENNYTLTPPEIFVQKLCFYLSGQTPGNSDGQPLVTIFVDGYTGKQEQNKEYFSIQTSVSQRGADLVL